MFNYSKLHNKQGENYLFNLFALLTKKKYWRLHSFFIKAILKVYKIRIGKNFYIEGIPKLKINGNPENIQIGNNVSILGDIDIRNRENGRIIIKNNVTIEHDCRFVAARDGDIIIDSGTSIGAQAVMNGGADIQIGKNCIFAVRVSINSNDHEAGIHDIIKNQGYKYAPVIIQDDCWFGANVAINKGVSIKKGSIIGANAVVTKDINEFSINVGIPAKQISKRK